VTQTGKSKAKSKERDARAILVYCRDADVMSGRRMESCVGEKIWEYSYQPLSKCVRQQAKLVYHLRLLTWSRTSG
jgi:hypothetical protein